jgi:hypothetical protein
LTSVGGGAASDTKVMEERAARAHAASGSSTGAAFFAALSQDGQPEDSTTDGEADDANYRPVIAPSGGGGGGGGAIAELGGSEALYAMATATAPSDTTITTSGKSSSRTGVLPNATYASSVELTQLQLELAAIVETSVDATLTNDVDGEYLSVVAGVSAATAVGTKPHPTMPVAPLKPEAAYAVESRSTAENMYAVAEPVVDSQYANLPETTTPDKNRYRPAPVQIEEDQYLVVSQQNEASDPSSDDDEIEC